ncbi:MAG: hypothetical protein Q8L73_05120 [Methylotenera sp.]|nr:hypothetical protein [Methylotenera sp.]
MKFIKYLITLFVAILLMHTNANGNDGSNKSEKKSCTNSMMPCVGVGALAFNLNLLGENSSIRFVWNPLIFIYSIEDSSKEAIAFVYLSGSPPPCLDTSLGTNIRTWQEKNRKYREIIVNKQVVQREVEIMVTKNSSSNFAFACTVKGLNPAKITSALNFLDSIEWSAN